MDKKTARIIWTAARSKFDKIPTRVDKDFEKWWIDQREQALDIGDVVVRSEQIVCDCDKWHDRMEESNNNCNTCGKPIK